MRIENRVKDKPPEDLVISAAIIVNAHSDKWEYDKFRTYLSEIEPIFLTRPCHTERLILLLIGLGITTKSDGQLDFKIFFDVFVKGANFMSNLYGDQGKIYLVNSFSITAPNFMKNLVFHGGPKIKQGVVKINNVSSLEDHISEFNKYFSSVNLLLERNDVKIECQHALKKINPAHKDHYSWISDWVQQS